MFSQYLVLWRQCVFALNSGVSIEGKHTNISTWHYDSLGRRIRIFNDDGLEVRYGYDALNRISRIHHGNGVETSYTYDGDRNVLLSFAYRYDGNGNRTAKTGTQVTLGGIIEEKIENEK